MSYMTFYHDDGFDPEQYAKQLGSRLVQTSVADYAIAMHKEDPSDCSDRTEFFDWHSDGLYHDVPPKYVLLHCLNPGHGRVMTELTDMSVVLSKLGEPSRAILRKLRSHYIGHGGNFAHPLMSDRVFLLASRGHLSPQSNLNLDQVPSIRETSEALSELYARMEENVASYEWSRGDMLIFNQYQYMHRRQSSEIDQDRKLIRMWFND